MRPFAKEFYTSQSWKQVREEYKRSVGGLCEECWSRGIVKAGELVHHKIPITPENINDPDITLGFDNLQCLCRECHAKAHDEKKLRYKFDELGRVICL